MDSGIEAPPGVPNPTFPMTSQALLQALQRAATQPLAIAPPSLSLSGVPNPTFPMTSQALLQALQRAATQPLAIAPPSLSLSGVPYANMTHDQLLHELHMVIQQAVLRKLISELAMVQPIPVPLPAGQESDADSESIEISSMEEDTPERELERQDMAAILKDVAMAAPDDEPDEDTLRDLT
ncbi:g12681 [Coccomyxa viridis]|uniref:G12681 protein n=1 Tax=Coccomyxa viridis TaxID=1274662 RepID=A0ABP1GAX9_9CHLO